MFSAVSKQGEVAPRTGFFHFFKRQEVSRTASTSISLNLKIFFIFLPKVLVLKWDHKTEDLTSDGVSSELVDRIRAGT